MKIEIMPIADIQEYENNAKAHPPEQVEKIAKSIEAFGFRNPVLVDKANVLIAGHGRILAARRLGLTEAPVIRIEDLTPEQARAFRIADNRVGESAWIDDILAAEIAALSEGEMDASLLGFTEEELNALQPQKEGATDPDDLPDIPEYDEPITKPGDLWLMGEHRLLCGDSTIANNALILMEGKRASMVLTDPPYGIGGLMKGGTWAKKQDKQFALMRKWDVSTDQKYLNNIIELEIPAIVWGGNYFLTPPSRCWLVWNKPEFPTMSSAELAWTNLNHNTKRIECVRAHQTGEGEKVHATQKPVQVMLWSMTFLPNQGILYDPFLGSGSTIIACEKTNRTCYGMEIEPYYCDIIVKRWEDFTGNKAVKA